MCGLLHVRACMHFCGYTRNVQAFIVVFFLIAVEKSAADSRELALVLNRNYDTQGQNVLLTLLELQLL